MKKITILTGIILSAILLISGFSKNTMDVKLYFADSSMGRLVPSDFTIKTRSRKKAAEKVISELLSGRDDNSKIMRTIPNVKNGLRVTVDKNIAYVNISDEFKNLHSDLRQHELLTIYSIVNSLTSIDGIVNVRFTIDNKSEKDFKGFCDMRETFIPDYYI